jgi:hypothetical protein
MGQDFQKRYDERAKYLDKVRQRNAIVAGRKDYDFTQHLPLELRGTYEGQALNDKWYRECFVPDYLANLEYEVDDLAELVAWEKSDDERFRRKNRLPPSPETRRAAIEAKRAARAAVADDPPPLPSSADDAMTDSAVERDEITLFGSSRKVQQVKSCTKRKDKKEND